MAMQLTYTLKPTSKTITSMLLSRSGASSSNGGGYGNGNMDELIKTNKAWKGNNKSDINVGSRDINGTSGVLKKRGIPVPPVVVTANPSPANVQMD